jgi:hypothetical protein
MEKWYTGQEAIDALNEVEKSYALSVGELVSLFPDLSHDDIKLLLTVAKALAGQHK